MDIAHWLTALLICCNEKNMRFSSGFGLPMINKNNISCILKLNTSVLRYGTTNNCLYYTVIWVDVLQQSEADLQPLASKLMHSMNNLNECSFRCLYCVKQTTWALTRRSFFSRRFVGPSFSGMLVIIEEDINRLGGELHPYWHYTLAKRHNDVA